jgi:hypothetical protein
MPIAPLLLAGAALAAPAATPAPAKTVKGTVLTRRAQTLAPGSRLPASRVGTRTFLTDAFGVALGSGSQAQYPVQTTDGGRTWRTDGPALHVDAANAPFAVSTVGAASKSLQYAYGGGQAVDVTADGGPTWRVALFNGLVMAVVPGFGAHELVAFVDAGGQHGPTWQYTTVDGGRTWHFSTRPGG